MGDHEAAVLQWERSEFPHDGTDRCTPEPSFLHSATQVGGKFVTYGGCSHAGDALSQLLVFDCDTKEWTAPAERIGVQGDEPAPRYGHSATLVSMTPPQMLVFGGMQGQSGADFEQGPTGSGGAGGQTKGPHSRARMWVEGGAGGGGAAAGGSVQPEEPSNEVFLLETTADSSGWSWSKPFVRSQLRPRARSEHTATKVGD